MDGFSCFSIFTEFFHLFDSAACTVTCSVIAYSSQCTRLTSKGNCKWVNSKFSLHARQIFYFERLDFLQFTLHAARLLNLRFAFLRSFLCHWSFILWIWLSRRWKHNTTIKPHAEWYIENECALKQIFQWSHTINLWEMLSTRGKWIKI